MKRARRAGDKSVKVQISSGAMAMPSSRKAAKAAALPPAGRPTAGIGWLAIAPEHGQADATAFESRRLILLKASLTAPPVENDAFAGLAWRQCQSAALPPC